METVSPPTTTDAVCACGQPCATFGSGTFSYTLPMCADCAAALEEKRAWDDQQAEASARRLDRLDRDLGPRFVRYTWNGYPADRIDARATAGAWVSRLLAGQPAQNLVLHGPAGEGKTGLAVVAAREVAEAGLSVRFFVGREWLDAVRRASLGQEDDGVEAAARSCRLLVLDDLGSERGTPFALERLLSLVDHRYRHELPTIVTSNFAPSGLVGELGRTDATIGERIVSRLVEGAVKIAFDYGNLRLAKAA